MICLPLSSLTGKLYCQLYFVLFYRKNKTLTSDFNPHIFRFDLCWFLQNLCEIYGFVRYEFPANEKLQCQGEYRRENPNGEPGDYI